MKKTVFKKPQLRLVLLVIFSFFMALSLYKYFTTWDFRTLIPIVFQALLFVLVYMRHRLALVIVRIWIILSLLIGPFLRLIRFVKMDKAPDDLILQSLIINSLLFILGGILLYFSFKLMKVSDSTEA